MLLLLFCLRLVALGGALPSGSGTSKINLVRFCDRSDWVTVSGSGDGATTRSMFNISKLPQVLVRAGLDLRNFMSTWQSQVDAELVKRTEQSLRKRSNSNMDMDTASEPHGHGDNASSSGALPETPTQSATTSQSQSPLSLQFGIPYSDDGDDVGDMFGNDDDAGSLAETRSAGSGSRIQKHRVQLEFPAAPAALVPLQAQPHAPGSADISVDTVSAIDPGDRLAFLESLDQSQLVSLSVRQSDLIAKQGKQIEQLRKDAKSNRQKIRRAQKKQEKQQLKLYDLQHPEMDQLDVLRGNAKKVSWRGAVSLGLRKTISFVSASSFPNAALLDVGRNTVIRAEIRSMHT